MFEIFSKVIFGVRNKWYLELEIIKDDHMGFPCGASCREPTWQCRRLETQVRSLDWEDPLEEGTPTPVFLPVESHRQRGLAVYSPWGHKPLNITKQLSMHYFITKYYTTYSSKYFTSSRSFFMAQLVVYLGVCTCVPYKNILPLLFVMFHIYQLG